MRCVPDRPVFLPNRDGHGAWGTASRSELAGVDAATPDPGDGRIEGGNPGRQAGGDAPGRRSALVGRLLPAVTDDDWYAALLEAQRYLLSLGITGGRTRSWVTTGRRPTRCPPTFARPGDGSLRATVVGALWWDRSRGLDQLPELLQRRASWRSDRFRATSVKMMLDGVAENHTAAMLEPYLGEDDCAGDHTGLDFIDPDELPRYVTALDSEGFQVALPCARRPRSPQCLRRHRRGPPRQRVEPASPPSRPPAGRPSR